MLGSTLLGALGSTLFEKTNTKMISSKNYIKIDTVVINIHGPMNRK